MNIKHYLLIFTVLVGIQVNASISHRVITPSIRMKVRYNSAGDFIVRVFISDIPNFVPNFRCNGFEIHILNDGYTAALVGESYPWKDASGKEFISSFYEKIKLPRRARCDYRGRILKCKSPYFSRYCCHTNDSVTIDVPVERGLED